MRRREKQNPTNGNDAKNKGENHDDFQNRMDRTPH